MSDEYTILEINQSNITIEGQNKRLKFQCSEIEVFFTELKISIQYLSPNMKVLLVQGSNSVIFNIKPSKNIYLFMVCKLKEQKMFVGRKNNDNLQKLKKIKFNKIYKLNQKDHCSKKNYSKLEGRVIYVNLNCKDRKKLLIEKEQIHREKNFELEEIGIGIVESMNFCIFKVKLYNNSFETVQIIDFCKTNSLPIEIDFKKYIGKRVLVKKFLQSQKKLFILLPESISSTKRANFESNSELELSMVMLEPPEFNLSDEVILNYEGNQGNFRCPLKQLFSPNTKIQSETASSYISPQIFNKSLGLIIGLAIFEHLFRFKTDTSFKDYTENILKQLDAFKHYADLSNPAVFASFRDFYSYFTTGTLINLKRIGEAYISNTKHDIETLEGIQDLCNLTGLCIHFHDFTEGFKQFKLVPLEYKLKKRPIIKLGKYFNNYFLIYSPDQMKFDQYDTNSQNLGKGVDVHKKCFPYYDEQESFFDVHLDEFLRSLAKKITENIDNFIAKIKGHQLKQTDFDLGKEVNDFRSSLLTEDIEVKKEAFDELNKIDFSSPIYLMTTAKYTCACCLEIIEENQKPKFSETKYCSHDFCDEHIKTQKYKYCMFCAILSQEKQNLGYTSF